MCVCVRDDLNFESTNQVGRSVDETLRLVQAFQYTEEHGEGIEFDVVLNASGEKTMSTLFSFFSPQCALQDGSLVEKQ